MGSVPMITGVQDLARALDWVRAHPLPSGRIISICLWGEMGVGKTQMVNQYARRRGMGFRVYHPSHDASRREALGLSYIDHDTDRTRFAVPEFLPTSVEVSALNPTGLLLIDEINRADGQVLAGLFELIGEGRISQSGYALPGGWQVVCCANPQGGRYQVQQLDPALVDRMLHLRVGFDADRWQEWAVATGVEEDVIRFIDREPHMVFHGEGDADPGVSPLATPRSLELFGALYEPEMPDDLMGMIAHGLLGADAAGSFLQGPRGAGRALSAEQVLSGLWRRYLPRWVAGQRGDLIRVTVERLLDHLSECPRDAATARELAGLRAALTAEQRTWFDAGLSSRAPDWFELVVLLASVGRAGPPNAGAPSG